MHTKVTRKIWLKGRFTLEALTEKSLHTGGVDGRVTPHWRRWGFFDGKFSWKTRKKISTHSVLDFLLVVNK